VTHFGFARISARNSVANSFNHRTPRGAAMRQPLMFKLDQRPTGRGLRCDGSGLFLGCNALLQRDPAGNFEARPIGALLKILGRTIGDETNWESHVRSVTLVADALNKGEMARAMMIAVLMRLPDPEDPIDDSDFEHILAKAGFNPDEPRDERGRWTAVGNSGAEFDIDDHEPRNTGHESETANADHRRADIQLADISLSDATDDPMVEAARRAVEAARREYGAGTWADSRSFEHDVRQNIVLAESEDEKEPRSDVSDYPAKDLIPQRLRQSPRGLTIELLDNLAGITEVANEANLQGSELQELALLQRIHDFDPNYIFASVEPRGGLGGMSWQDRNSVICRLQADLAATIYRVRGDIRPLQEVTLDFMQRTANTAYDECVRRDKAGNLDARIPPQLAMGNCVDGEVRRKLRDFFESLGISMDPKSAVRVNRRAYDTAYPPPTYRVPDARVGNLAFDVSLEAKRPTKDQIRDIFNSDFKPAGVVIVRPNQLGNNSSYVIWRPKGG